MEFISDPETYVAIGFLAVVGILLWVGVPKMVAGLLDARAAGIKAELDEARRLREEAQGVLAGFQQKAASADREAQSIVDEAHAEAARFKAEAEATLVQQIERRKKVAQDKIGQAEAAAIAEIRHLAADAAASAAGKLIAARLDDARAASLIDDSIKSLGGKLN